jgi:hypothetical protein
MGSDHPHSASSAEPASEHGSSPPGLPVRRADAQHDAAAPGANGAPHRAPAPAGSAAHPQHQGYWLWIMCLTGVDYFSTLAYQPSIAFESAGLLAPLATVILILVTLFGALPVYSYVAARSSQGQGSIAMLEALMRGWRAKMIVLILLGFAATDFVITKTLSAADAAVHLIHNPLWNRVAPDFIQRAGEDPQQLYVTMFLLVALGVSFLRGFKEVIGAAVVIVGVNLALNGVVIVAGLAYLVWHPALFDGWLTAVENGHWQIPHAPLAGAGIGAMIATCLLLFPKLALGLSGFETGVAVMPLISGDPTDDPRRPAGRIRNTRKLLVTAAAIMSVLLLGSSLVTATLIPAEALLGEGPAKDRALAFLAHGEGALQVCPMFGELFGTIYDLSTVLILGFAGASAMAGLLNLVPQYLPRYGMAPEWSRAIKPLVLMFTMINLLVTWIFRASVEAQGGAYATGVLVLITSACVATVIDRYRSRKHWRWRVLRVPWGFAAITVVFFYTTAANMIERPDGIKIASCFIAAIMASSFLSRMRRSTELRFDGFAFANPEARFLWDSLKLLEFPILVPHRPGRRELCDKESKIRERHRLPAEVPIVFVEAELGDTSEFGQIPELEIYQSDGRFVLKVRNCASVAHVIAIVALELSKFGTPPEIHFGWSNENPIAASASFFLFGEGNVPWMVRELIRKHEPNSERQPRIVVG